MTIDRSGVVGSAILLSGIVLAAGLGSVAGAWPHPTDLLGERLDQSANDERAEDLESQRARLADEIAFSNDLTARLAADSLSLADAAEQMEPLLRERTGFDVACSILYRVPNTRLGAARYLIGKIERLLEPDPSAWAAASARLSAEYAAMQ